MINCIISTFSTVNYGNLRKFINFDQSERSIQMVRSHHGAKFYNIYFYFLGFVNSPKLLEFLVNRTQNLEFFAEQVLNFRKFCMGISQKFQKFGAIYKT
jgi:hypothetical protein